MRIIRLHKRPTPKGTAEQCVKGLLDSNTRLDACKSSQELIARRPGAWSVANFNGQSRHEELSPRILGNQSPVTMRLGTGPSCAKFALLARPCATSRATDSFYLFESRLLAHLGPRFSGNGHGSTFVPPWMACPSSSAFALSTSEAAYNRRMGTPMWLP